MDQSALGAGDTAGGPSVCPQGHGCGDPTAEWAAAMGGLAPSGSVLRKASWPSAQVANVARDGARARPMGCVRRFRRAAPVWYGAAGLSIPAEPVRAGRSPDRGIETLPTSLPSIGLGRSKYR